MDIAYGLDPDQGLQPEEEEQLARLAAELGYRSAWTPSRADERAFDRCLRWHEASGLAVGIAVVPASGRPSSFYAEHATRVWERTGGHFTLGVGSGNLARPLETMAEYIAELRAATPPALPIYLAALGPRMLELAGRLADGVALNWCTPEQVASSRDAVTEAAAAAGRATPRVAAYIRTAVDPDAPAARAALVRNAMGYGLGPGAYRRHFERMGILDDLRRIRDEGLTPTAAVADTVGGAGSPGEVRGHVEQLSAGLDVAIVRILATDRGSAESARRVLLECAPNGARG